VKIEVIQHNPTVGDFEGNLNRILSLDKTNADIIVIPELAIAGYYPKDLLNSSDFILGVVSYQEKLVRSLSNDKVLIFGGIRVNGGYVENGAYVCFRSNCYFVPKLTLPNYGPFDEKRHFSLLDTYNGVFRIGDFSFAVGICEDMWSIPSEIFHKTAVSLYVFINASPFELGKFTRRLEFARIWSSKGSYVVYANLVGGNDGIIFDGASFVIDPNGEIIMLLKPFEEDSGIVSPVFPLIKNKTNDAGNVISPISIDYTLSSDMLFDSKVEEYPSYPENIYKAVVLGIRDYVQKSGFRKVIIPVSGGIDSAVGLVLAVEAIGNDNIVAVTMPSHITSSETLNDAIRLAKNLGVEIIKIPISEMYTVMRNMILSSTNMRDKFDIADENIQARIRGVIAMYLANKINALVLSMGNKSEIAMGYNTLYGDTVGAYAPLGDLYKTDVYALARYINREKEIIPWTIVNRKPSAELRENQHDEDTLPPYPKLDRFLIDYIERKLPLKVLYQLYGRSFVDEVVSRIEKMEYKRQQLPPSPKIRSNSFYTDRRYPIVKRNWWY